MILLILATFFSVLILYGALAGEKYAEMCEPLDDGDFPLKDFYTIGFAISMGLPKLKMPKQLAITVRRYVVLLYGEMYADYYLASVWAGFITLVFFLNSFVLLFGIFIAEAPTLFFIVCCVLTYAIWNMTVARPADVIKQRESECNNEFPNAVSKLALLINSGMVLREAWKLTAANPAGQLYELMRQTVEMMDNGASDIEALHRFGVLSDSQEIKKFAGMVIQSIEKGGLNLPDYLLGQASALLELKKQEMLRKGEEAAGKLIAPIGIMFAGIMLIIIAASMQSFTGL